MGDLCSRWVVRASYVQTTQSIFPTLMFCSLTLEVTQSKAPIYNRIKNYNFSIIGDEVLEVLDHLKIQSTLDWHFAGNHYH